LKLHPIVPAVDLAKQQRRRDRIRGILIVVFVLLASGFIAIPLWIHWAEVILEFWGIKRGRFTFL
jgi:hypothetical protein